MNKTDPKILIVNAQSIYDENATGITLRSIFSCFDSDRIKEVYYSHVQSTKNAVSTNIQSFQIKTQAVPLNYLVRKVIGKGGIAKYNESISTIDMRSKAGKANKKVQLKTYLLGLINYSPLFIRDKALIKEIDRFSPDIVYTLGADIIPLKMAVYFAKRYQVPILVHYMDNWVETKYADSLATRLFYKKLHGLLNYIQKENQVALVISDKMAAAYDKLFKPVHHYPIMNSVSTNYKQELVANHSNSLVIFAYLGGLHLGRNLQLLQIEKAIKESNKNNQIKARLKIYTSEENQKRFRKDFDDTVVEFCDYVLHEKIFEEYQKADVLVHIESFDEELVEFTKYSLSTKISEYLFSGKPIILFAPKDLAVYEYLSSNNAGICTDNYDDLERAIEVLVKDENKRLLMGANGRQLSLVNHTCEAAHNTLVRACNELIKVGGAK